MAELVEFYELQKRIEALQSTLRELEDAIGVIRDNCLYDEGDLVRLTKAREAARKLLPQQVESERSQHHDHNDDATPTELRGGDEAK